MPGPMQQRRRLPAQATAVCGAPTCQQKLAVGGEAHRPQRRVPRVGQTGLAAPRGGVPHAPAAGPRGKRRTSQDAGLGAKAGETTSPGMPSVLPGSWGVLLARLRQPLSGAHVRPSKEQEAMSSCRPGSPLKCAPTRGQARAAKP